MNCLSETNDAAVPLLISLLLTDDENIKSKSEISNTLNFVNVGANLCSQAGAIVTFKLGLLTKYLQICIPDFFNQLYHLKFIKYLKIKILKKQLFPKIFPSNFVKLLVNE